VYIAVSLMWAYVCLLDNSRIMSFDLDIWHGSSSYTYLGYVCRSRSYSSV